MTSSGATTGEMKAGPEWTVLCPSFDALLVQMLLKVAEYAGPGYVPTASDWDLLYRLGLDHDLVTWGPEPLGTYGPDGREEYGAVVHVTQYGKEEVEAHRALLAAAGFTS